jgi:hypothetical protein
MIVHGTKYEIYMYLKSHHPFRNTLYVNVYKNVKCIQGTHISVALSYTLSAHHIHNKRLVSEIIADQYRCKIANVSIPMKDPSTYI